MTEKLTVIGFEKEWEIFLKNHPLWPEKYFALTSTLHKVFIRNASTASPADKVVFFLGRLSVEDLNEIFLLCGNGYGIGALKLLRGLYERVVTLGYIAENPDQAISFLEYHHIHKGKMIDHAGKIFDLKKHIKPEELAEAKDNYKTYKNKFQTTDCKKCGTTKTMFSWSKLDIASMAKQIGYDDLYFPGFFYPTLQTHVTPTSLMERLKIKEDGNITFNEGAQHEWAGKALITAHNLILYVLMIQNTYFKLNIDSEIEQRENDFYEMWAEEIKD